MVSRSFVSIAQSSDTRRSRWAVSERPAQRIVPILEASMAKTKDRKLKKVHVPAHTKIVNGKKVKVKEHYRSTPG